MALQVFGGKVLEYFPSPHFDDFVHELNQVGLLVESLLVLSEIFDCVINEVSHVLVAFLVVVQIFQKVFDVFLALLCSVGLVAVLQSHDGDVKALLDHLGLHLGVHEELP